MDNLLNPPIMAVEIEEGEEDAAGLLDTCETEKGPFSVELVKGEVGVVFAEMVCDLPLAVIVAF